MFQSKETLSVTTARYSWFIPASKTDLKYISMNRVEQNELPLDNI